MALEPLDISAALPNTEYTCPMHPEIVRDEPGSCPICGMALEPRAVNLTEEENPELKDMTRVFGSARVCHWPCSRSPWRICYWANCCPGLLLHGC